jgi:polyisoprenoid-binding protein YceI
VLVNDCPSHAKEKLVTRTTPGPQLKPGWPLRPATGNWRVNQAHSQATFEARVAGRTVRGRLPLTGHAIIAEPIEDSTALLAAKAGEVSTATPVLDRLLAGPGFLDAAVFPEITMRSDLMVLVPTGWRAVGRLQVKGTEHEMACQLSVQHGGNPLDGPSLWITARWVIDSRWITRQWPTMSRRIPMTCSFLLEPEM